MQRGREILSKHMFCCREIPMNTFGWHTLLMTDHWVSPVTAILEGENYCPYRKLDCHFVQVFVLNQHLEDVRPQQEKTWRGEVPKFEEWGLK